MIEQHFMEKYGKDDKIEVETKIIPTDIIITFYLDKTGNFELRLNFPEIENVDVKIEHCQNFAKFLRDNINPSLYPLVRLLLDKASRENPNLLFDYKIISNLLSQLEIEENEPIVDPTEAFMMRNNNGGN